MMYKLTAKFEIMVVADSPNEAIEYILNNQEKQGIFVEQDPVLHCEPCLDLRDIPSEWLDVWPYGDFDKPCSKYFEEEEEI